VEGFADHTSVDVGDRFALYVSTSARTFRAVAYRLGYYQGLGGREVWRSDRTRGDQQATPTVTPDTNMVEAPWDPTMTVPTTGWPQGSYLIKLKSSTGGASYVPIVVRDDTSDARLLLVQQVNTWEAYNAWGGYSLYHGPKGFDDRSRIVSFDRPYDANGAGGILRSMPFIAIAERAGMDVTYSTDVDIHLDRASPLRHRAVILLNHSEYWSAGMRHAVLAARASGVNLADFGANAMYRHIRYASSPLGEARRVVCYKVAREDPLWGVNPGEVTANWRAGPVPRPESAITGAMYRCHGVRADMVVADPVAWVFANTGLAKGDHLHLAVSGEVDAVFPDEPTPANLQILAHSPVACAGTHVFAVATYYTASSGAGVADVGSTDWYRTLRCGIPFDDARCNRRAVEITRTVLRVFANGPAGVRHPANSNLSAYGYDLSDPITP